MSQRYSGLLGVSRTLIKLLRILNLAFAPLLVGMFLASFAFEPVFQEFFTKQPASIDPGLLIPVLRLWMLLALPMLAVVHVMLTRLLAMINTVRAGDPFVPENAARLTVIAWCLLGLQLFNLLFGAMAATLNAAGSNIAWTHSWNGWLAVLLVFVLARVFEEGTRIRADLEAMI